MLTAEQILNAQFALISKGAYRQEEVDAFLRSTAESYEELTAQNEELMSKLRRLADLVEQYRADEDTIKSTMISAQRMAKTVTTEAEEEAARIRSEAEAEARATIEKSRQTAEGFIAKTKDTTAAYLEKAKSDAARIVEEANATASATVAAANARAEEIIGDSQKRLASNEARSQALEKAIATYQAAVRAACEQQLAAIEGLGAIGDIAAENIAFVPEQPVIAEVPGTETFVPSEPEVSIEDEVRKAWESMSEEEAPAPAEIEAAADDDDDGLFTDLFADAESADQTPPDSIGSLFDIGGFSVDPVEADDSDSDTDFEGLFD